MFPCQCYFTVSATRLRNSLWCLWYLTVLPILWQAVVQRMCVTVWVWFFSFFVLFLSPRCFLIYCHSREAIPVETLDLLQKMCFSCHCDRSRCKTTTGLFASIWMFIWSNEPRSSSSARNWSMRCSERKAQDARLDYKVLVWSSMSMLNYVNSFNTLWGMVDLKLYSVFQKMYVCKLPSVQPMGAA